MSYILKFEEGFRAVPYSDSEGFVSIGYGKKLHTLAGLDPKYFTLRISEETAKDWMEADLTRLDVQLLRSRVGADQGIYRSLDDDPVRSAIILSMAYQMGVEGLLGFTDMWAALGQGNYDLAADAMLDSLWGITQTPERAARHAQVMREGKHDNAYPSIPVGAY